MTSFTEPVLTSESFFSPVALSITHWQGNTTPGCVQAVVSVSRWGCCCMKTHSMKPPAKSCVSFVKTHSQFLSCLWDTWIFILGFLFLSARCFTQFSVVQAWMKSSLNLSSCFVLHPVTESGVKLLISLQNEAVYCCTAGNCLACQCVELKIILFPKNCCYNWAFRALYFGAFNRGIFSFSK